MPGMARKLRIQYEGSICHVTFRGNARRAIFVRDRDIVALALMRRCGLTERAAAAELGLGTGSAVSYLVRQVKARCRAEPDTAELVRRVTLAEAPR